MKILDQEHAELVAHLERDFAGIEVEPGFITRLANVIVGVQRAAAELDVLEAAESTIH